MVDHGAVFEPECNNEEVSFRTRVGGQADESHPVWGDLLARAYPEPCPGFGGSVGQAVFGLSTSDRGTKDHSPIGAGSLGLGGSQREKGGDSIQQFEGEVRKKVMSISV